MAEPLVGMRGPRRERALDLVAGVIARQRPVAVAWAQRAMAARPDRTAVLAGLGAPAAVLWGELDEVTTGEDAAAMAAELGVPVTTLPGVGHLSPVEDAPGVAYALRGAFP
jgi:pimeloyl-ACP methyl ester carboxylesterase